MREIALEALKKEIIKPGIERHIAPLATLRGKTQGGVHRMWNYSVSMMMHEASLSDATQRLGCNARWSQLCMPMNRPSALQIGIFTGALREMPKVAANHRGLLDYMMDTARWIIGPNDTWHVARDTWKPYQSDNPYPFLVHEGNRPIDPLVELIAQAVPKHLDRETRADLCQDLAVAILCGDLAREDVQEGIRCYLPKVRKMFPAKWGPISLDATIPGMDGLTRHDLISGPEYVL